jgi:imidazolonepropionase-like amidohydrolase
MAVRVLPAAVPPHGMGCFCCTPFLRDFTRRVTADLSRRTMMMGLGASASSVGLGVYRPARAQTEAPAETPGATVFSNVRLFDGRSDALRDGLAVVVQGEKVTEVRDAAAPAPANAEVIDGRGGVLMPGLIDAHRHTIMAAVPQATALTADPSYMHIVAAEEAERTLMRGFTSVRDAGGPAFGLKRAIDEGQIVGPRIFPSGAMISQTSGHADFRSVNELPRFPGTPGSHLENVGAGMIADGRDEVLRGCASS